MNIKATGLYSIKRWTEQNTLKLCLPQKATQAEIEFTMTGSMQGCLQGTLLLHYINDKDSTFTGMQHFSGVLDAKEGGFICVSKGQYKNGVITCQWRILPGSGTEQLTNISGVGGYTTGHQPSVDYHLAYNLDLVGD
jgi:hypothetical protein